MIEEFGDSTLESITVAPAKISPTVYVVPLGAPIPSELSELPVTEGTLYDRLRPLASKLDTQAQIMFLKGEELVNLDKVWRSLQVAKDVQVLRGLPGAVYDVLFTQAARLLGLKEVEWTQIADALTTATREAQRSRDRDPWIHDPAKRKEQLPGSNDEIEPLPLPDAPLDEEV